MFFYSLAYIIAWLTSFTKIWAFRNPGLLSDIVRKSTEWSDRIVTLLVGESRAAEDLMRRIFGGDFIFGSGVWLTSYNDVLEMTQKPQYRKSIGLGFPFNTNLSATYLTVMMDEDVHDLVIQEWRDKGNIQKTKDDLERECEEIINRWTERDNFREVGQIHRFYVELLTKVIGGVELDQGDLDLIVPFNLNLYGYNLYFGSIADNYLYRRGMEYISILNKKYGLNYVQIDIITSAAFFGLYFLIQPILDNIDKVDRVEDPTFLKFIFEVARLNPSVTHIHNVLLEKETRTISRSDIELEPGTIIFGHLLSANKDESIFENPLEFIMGRENIRDSLSWNRGNRRCPGRDLSISILQVAVDRLAN